MAVLWFGRLVDRPELAHLEPGHREAVAAEVALAVVRRWPARVLRSSVRGYFIPLLLCFFGGPALMEAMGVRPGPVALVGLALPLSYLLLVWSLHATIRLQALRRLREVLEREAVDPDSPARLLWAPAALQLRGELERLCGDPWAFRVVAWRLHVFDGPGGDTERPLHRLELATEAAARASKDPLVRTMWRLATLFPIIMLLAMLFALVSMLQGTLSSLAPYWSLLAAAPLLVLAAERRGRRLTRGFYRELLFATGLRPARCFACRRDLAGVTDCRCPGCGATIGRE